MSSAIEETGLSPFDYLRPVWRFKWGVLLVVAAAAAATYFYYDHRPKHFETGTQLYVGQSSLDQLLGSTSSPAGDARALANQARLVTTPQVAGVVARRLRLNVSPQALLGVVSVHPDAEADFLTIVTEASSGQLAADLANGFARAYIAVRRASIRADAQRALANAQEQLLRVDAADVTTQTALRDRIAVLQSAVLSPPASGQQLSRAPVPTTPTSPKPVRNAIFAGVLALMLAIILAYLLDRSDRRVRQVDDVEALYDAPVLAALPHVRRPLPKPRRGVVTVDDLSEAYRTLRVNIDLARKTEGLRTLLVASALPEEGKSSVVRNLAIAYRDAGLRVAVLETDLRRPSLAGLLGVVVEPGLVEALQEPDAELDMQHVAEAAGDGAGDNGHRQNGRHGAIDVLVSGEPADNPTALLTAERLRPVLATLASRYDVVLLDSAPILSVGDALPLLPLVDGVVLVVRVGLSTGKAAARLRRTLTRVANVRVLGVVVNDVPDDPGRYYRAPAAVARPAPRPRSVPAPR